MTQTEVLAFLEANRGKGFTAKQIAQEMGTNLPHAITTKAKKLVEFKFVEKSEGRTIMGGKPHHIYTYREK